MFNKCRKKPGDDILSVYVKFVDVNGKVITDAETKLAEGGKNTGFAMVGEEIAYSMYGTHGVTAKQGFAVYTYSRT